MEAHTHTNQYLRPFPLHFSAAQRHVTTIYEQQASSPTSRKLTQCSDEQNAGGNCSKAKDGQKGESFPKLTPLFCSHLSDTLIKWTVDVNRNPSLLVEHAATIPQGKSVIINYLAYKWCNVKTQSHIMGFFFFSSYGLWEFYGIQISSVSCVLLYFLLTLPLKKQKQKH